MTTKTFPTIDVIATHSGVMLTQGQFPAICAVASHIAGQGLMTHQMATEQPAIAAILERQHPWLAGLSVPTMSSVKDFSLTEGEQNARYAAAVNRFAAKVFDEHGATLDITTDPSFPGLHPLDGLPENSAIVTIPDVR